MGNLVPVADWRSNQKCRNLDVLTGALSKEVFPRRGDVAGFYFSRPQCGEIVCFVDAGMRKVVAKNHIIELNDARTALEVSSKWPFIRLVLTNLDFNIEFREAAPLDLMVARVDPSLDFMDWSTRYFACHLYEQYVLAQE